MPSVSRERRIDFLIFTLSKFVRRFMMGSQCRKSCVHRLKRESERRQQRSDGDEDKFDVPFEHRDEDEEEEKKKFQKYWEMNG